MSYFTFNKFDKLPSHMREFVMDLKREIKLTIPNMSTVTNQLYGLLDGYAYYNTVELVEAEMDINNINHVRVHAKLVLFWETVLTWKEDEISELDAHINNLY